MARGKIITSIPLSERPLCPECGVNLLPFKNYSKKTGKPLYRKSCHSCREARTGAVRSNHNKYKAVYARKRRDLTCDKCGFKAEDPIQLDVDHIDGNHDNNDPSNHQVLCANCHRLKTKRNQDGVKSRIKARGGAAI